jgi:hypothetical protein
MKCVAVLVLATVLAVLWVRWVRPFIVEAADPGRGVVVKCRGERG